MPSTAPTTSPEVDAPSTATVSTVIAADIDTVWRLVSDPSRYGAYSPENTGADRPDELVVGSVFTGHNAREGNEWSTECTVTELRAPTRFAFHAGDDEVGTTWRFVLRDLGDAGTQVSESFDSLRLRHPEWIDVLPGRHGQLVADVQATLAALRHAAEEVGA